MRSIAFLVRPVVAACALAGLLVACGGGPGGGSSTPAAPTTTLSVSPSSLALSVNDPGASPALTGKPRIFTITNIGSAPALSVISSNPTWPLGTTHDDSDCATLAPLATCEIIITPGSTASAAPITLSIGGSNTNLLEPTVLVLEYGSVYQEGYVFDIDDTTDDIDSIGGKVVALDDIVASPLPWSTSPNLINASSLNDGVANTQAIVAVYDGMSVPRADYAAGACTELDVNGYVGWYLPAICEMSTAAAGCAPGQPDIQSLVDNSGALPPTPLEEHWSSTESAGDPFADALRHQFALLGGSQSDPAKGTDIQVRCVRELTY